jgi:hypothetical protein
MNNGSALKYDSPRPAWMASLGCQGMPVGWLWATLVAIDPVLGFTTANPGPQPKAADCPTPASTKIPIVDHERQRHRQWIFAA